MTKKDVLNATTQEILDWLCYHCWREYDKACRKGENAQKKIENEIKWMKEELLRRAQTGGF
ncbi:MAG: hypothetical protein IKB71_03855 [Lentisphaeria bacterium]|nr:hypothetical protein [Lentisphaeria bacterium]